MEAVAYVGHLFVSGGLVMYPLLLLSLITVTIAIERRYYFKHNTQGIRGFIHGVYHSIKVEDWDTVDELCRQYPMALSRVVQAGLRDTKSERRVKDGFMEQMTMEMSSFKQYLDYLSAIVTVAPLLRLLGTVTGMIGTFGALDAGGGAAAVTGGIGEALIATASGLCVAIIAFAVYTFYNHKLDHFIVNSEKTCLMVVNNLKREWE